MPDRPSRNRPQARSQQPRNALPRDAGRTPLPTAPPLEVEETAPSTPSPLKVGARAGLPTAASLAGRALTFATLTLTSHLSAYPVPRYNDKTSTYTEGWEKWPRQWYRQLERMPEPALFTLACYLDAGYPYNEASPQATLTKAFTQLHELHEAGVYPQLTQLMDLQGLSDAYLVGKLSALLSADDKRLQFNALQLALKMRGHLKEHQQTTHATQIIIHEYADAPTEAEDEGIEPVVITVSSQPALAAEPSLDDLQPPDSP